MRRIRHLFRRIIHHPRTPLVSIVIGVVVIVLTLILSLRGNTQSSEAINTTPTPQLGLVAGESTEISPTEEPAEASGSADMTIRVSPTIRLPTYTPTQTPTLVPATSTLGPTSTPTSATATPTQSPTSTQTPTITPTPTDTIEPSISEIPSPTQ